MYRWDEPYNKNIKREEETLNGRRLMSESRILSRKPVMLTLVIAIDVAIFLLFDFIVNVILATFTGGLMTSLTQLPRMFLPSALVHYGRGAWYTYIFLFVVLAIVDLVLIFRLRVSQAENRVNIGQRGTMRWTTLDEIKDQYRSVPEIETDKERRAGGYPMEAGIPICRNKDKIYIDNSDTINNLIVGMTGSGKTEMLVYPMIDVYSRSYTKPAIVAIDPSAELFKSSKDTLEARGYEVHILNLIDPTASMGYNPLTYVVDLYEKGDVSNAQLVANSIATMIVDPDAHNGNNHYFYVQAQNMLSAMILAMAEDCLKEEKEHPGRDCRKKVNLYSVYRAYSEMSHAVTKKGESALDHYFMSRDTANVARLKYASVPRNDPRVMDSISSTMTSKILLFVYDNVAKMTAESSVRLEDLGFGNTPIAVFITLPARDRSKDILASLFINQAYFALTTRCAEDGECARPVKFVCDEFWILPRLNDFDGMIVMNRKFRISFDLVVQNYQQLEDKYHDSADTIIGNCANQFYLLSSDPKTNKKFSEMIGDKTITTVHRTGRYLAIDKNFSENAEGRALVNETEISKLHKGECIVLRTRKREDNVNNDITQYPIFNHGETRFKYRWEYLQEHGFPDAKSIVLSEKNTETREGIHLSECFWDATPFIRRFLFHAQNSGGAGGDGGRTQRLVSTIPAPILEQVMDFLTECLGANWVANNIEDTLTVDELNAIIQAQEDLSAKDKGTLSTLISPSMAQMMEE